MYYSLFRVISRSTMGETELRLSPDTPADGPQPIHATHRVPYVGNTNIYVLNKYFVQHNNYWPEDKEQLQCSKTNVSRRRSTTWRQLTVNRLSTMVIMTSVTAFPKHVKYFLNKVMTYYNCKLSLGMSKIV